MRRFLAVLITTAAIFSTTAVTSSAPAQAASVSNAQGCGTDLRLDLDSAVLLLPGATKTYSNVSFYCVVSLQPIALGPFVLPFGPGVAAGGKFTVKIDNTGTWLPPTINFKVTLVSGTADACIPFVFNIGLIGTNPNRAGFDCIGLRTYIKNNAIDTSKGFFGLPEITSLHFTMVAGTNADNPGSVNGFQPFKLSGLLSLLNGIIIPLINQYIPGPLTSPVQVNTVA